MLARVISGAVLVLILIGLLIPGGYVLLGGCFLISAVGFYELYKALAKQNGEKVFDGYYLIGNLGILSWYATIFFFGIALESMVVLLAVLFLMLGIYIFTFPKSKCEKPIEAFFAFLYCPVLISFIYLTRQLSEGIFLVWLIFIASWISDTGAFFVGKAIGKHRLAPVLSPKKSIEGSIGGIVLAASCGAVYGLVLQNMNALNLPYQIALFAVIGGAGSVLSQLGDLAASGIKRDRGVKDYGKLIPGHGGIMDRFDSVIVTSPIIFFLSYYFFR